MCTPLPPPGGRSGVQPPPLLLFNLKMGKCLKCRLKKCQKNKKKALNTGKKITSPLFFRAFFQYFSLENQHFFFVLIFVGNFLLLFLFEINLFVG